MAHEKEFSAVQACCGINGARPLSHSLKYRSLSLQQLKANGVIRCNSILKLGIIKQDIIRQRIFKLPKKTIDFRILRQELETINEGRNYIC